MALDRTLRRRTQNQNLRILKRAHREAETQLQKVQRVIDDWLKRKNLLTREDLKTLSDKWNLFTQKISAYSNATATFMTWINTL